MHKTSQNGQCMCQIKPLAIKDTNEVKKNAEVIDDCNCVKVKDK